jgi:hypothetical protein
MKKVSATICAVLVATVLISTIVIASISSKSIHEQDDELITALSSTSLILFGKSDKYDNLMNKMIEISSNVTSVTSAAPDTLSKRVANSNSIVLADATWVKTQNTSEIVASLKSTLDKGAPLICFGEMSDVVSRTGYSLDYVGGCDLIFQGIKVFEGGRTAAYSGAGNIEDDDEVDKALISAVSWAYKWLSNELPISKMNKTTSALSDPQLSSGAYWGWVHDWEYNSNDDLKPYGRTNIQNEYSFLQNDNINQYDWYAIHFCQEAVPGKVAYKNGYSTMHMHTIIDADYGPHDSDELVRRGPTTSGSTTTSVNIGVTAGSEGAAVSCGHSWSYAVNDVEVLERGDMSIERGDWKHEVANGCNVAKNTYNIYPGATIRVGQGGPIQPYESYANAFGQESLWVWMVKSEKEIIHMPFILA